MAVASRVVLNGEPISPYTASMPQVTVARRPCLIGTLVKGCVYAEAQRVRTMNDEDALKLLAASQTRSLSSWP